MNGVNKVPLKPFRVKSTEPKYKNEAVLYRHFSTSGELLYIGISFDPLVRLNQHSYRTAWWDEIAYITFERGWSGRQALLDAEREAIKSEYPKYNKCHTT